MTNRIIALFTVLIFSVSLLSAQTSETRDMEKVDREIQKALQEAQKALDEVDFDEINDEVDRAMREVKIALNEIDVEEISRNVEEGLREAKQAINEIDMDEVRKSLPTKEEMESYKKEVRDAMRELEDLDLSPLEEFFKELSEIFDDNK